MGKKGSSKKALNGTSGSQSISLREESTGKRHTNVNAKSMLKLEHLKNLAVWSSEEAYIPSLAAFFGHHLATSIEALGAPPDPSLFTCQRCESVLHPGYNCTIRIEKNTRKVRSSRKKSMPGPQNYLVYKCHFCSHQNLLRGTSKGHMKEICPRKHKALERPEPSKASGKSDRSIRLEPSKATPHKSASEIISYADNAGSIKMEDEVRSSEILMDDSIPIIPRTPLGTPTLTLLEAKMKKRNRSSAKKPVVSEGVSAVADAGNIVISSNKRRRKSWTSLKEIAESSGKDCGRKLSDLSIPFSL